MVGACRVLAEQRMAFLEGYVGERYVVIFSKINILK
jgi:hypothetical protein